MKKNPNKNLNKSNKYLWIAIFFLFIQIIVIVRNSLESYYSYFWYCDFVAIIFAFAFFFKKLHLAKALINFGLVVQIIFLGGLFYKLFFKNIFLGDIFTFTTLNLFLVLSTVLIHLSTTLGLIFSYQIKPEKKTVYYSLIFVLIVYFVTLIFTKSSGSVNFVYSIPMTFRALFMWIPFYTELWVLVTFIVVILPTQALQYLLWKITRKK